jgi:nucleotide-binding universal stress UspA family protein
VSSAARCLAEYADRRSANLILVSSHYRTGLTRWRFGSFSEAVVKEAPCPVLFLTSHTAQHLNKVLWATDFSPHCERTFFDFVECTEGLVQEIELFHDVSLMLEPMSFVACAGAVMPLPEHAAEEQRTWAMQRSELWLAKIEHHGMRGRLQVQVDVGDVADHVLRVAKDRGVGLIAMASQVGSLSSMIFGSESFKVFRSGELPTWIYGPQTQL